MAEDKNKESSIACAELAAWMMTNGVSAENAEEIIKFMDVDPKSEGYILCVKCNCHELLERPRPIPHIPHATSLPPNPPSIRN